jgi:hypothetical protein
MLIIGCDFHTRYQQIAMMDDATGELTERRLEHQNGEANTLRIAVLSCWLMIWTAVPRSYCLGSYYHSGNCWTFPVSLFFSRLMMRSWLAL